MELRELLALPPDVALSRFQSGPEGLSSDRAASRRATAGENVLPRTGAPSLVRLFIRQLGGLLAGLLWIAAVLAVVAGTHELAVAIVAVVVLNGTFSFLQEVRATHAVRELARLMPDLVTVVRDGARRRISARELVPGDVLVLRAGDRIGADARVLASNGLEADLSTLTGESEPVARGPEPVPVVPEPLADAPNFLPAGGWITSGSGTAVVTATGADTVLARIVHLTGTVEHHATPLRRELDRAARRIAAACVGAGLFFLAIFLLLGMPWHQGLVFAVGVIVALVPEGLLPTLTLALAVGARRMARRGALVRHLEAVETLGATTVICTDKTGTLTSGRMRVHAVVPVSDVSPHALLRAAVLCSEAHVETAGRTPTVVGAPSERALLERAMGDGLDVDAERRTHPRVSELPFDPVRRRMSSIHPRGEAFEVLVKGAPEAVLARCRRHDGLPSVEDAAERFADDGLHVLAFARRLADELPNDAETAERDLELLGLVALEDPVRDSVPEAIARCRAAGMRVLVLTGDHPGTARAVVRSIGLGGRVVTGDELPHDEASLAHGLEGVAAVARVSPEHKLLLARALQARGEVVAMTGDGVNDAPALEAADIGVAMGASGTDVAREAADLVLLDDDFTHIVEAVEQGRAAFSNIRRFLTYHLTDNVAELAPFVVWAASGGQVPLLLSVLQVIALDLGTDLLPALALGAEPADGDEMKRPPRARTERLLDGPTLTRAFGFLGPVEALVSFAAALAAAAIWLGWRPGAAFPDPGSRGLVLLSTVLFSSVVLMQLANALECRHPLRSAFSRRLGSNRLLVFALAAEVLTLVAFTALPFFQRLLGHEWLSAGQWALVIATPFVLVAAEELRKARARRAPGIVPPRAMHRRVSMNRVVSPS